jgi:DNA topoisomerase IA
LNLNTNAKEDEANTNAKLARRSGDMVCGLKFSRRCSIEVGPVSEVRVDELQGRATKE